MPPASRPADHDFLYEQYLARNDSDRQRQFRKLAPMPYGVVLLARDEMDEQTIRQHFRTMKKLGYTGCKQLLGGVKWPKAKLEQMALEEGLDPWWYGQGGWEPITDQLLDKLGIDKSLAMPEIRQHPAMVEHQKQVFAARIGRREVSKNVEAQAGFHLGANVEARGSKAYGADAKLPDWATDDWIEWLREQYDDDLDKLNRAWNTDVVRVSSTHDGFESWEEVAEKHGVNAGREYGRVGDLLRFKAEMKGRYVEALCRRVSDRDPHQPHRSGGEMGVFLPFASRGTDMELIASALKDTGSFYPSIHFCWHFEEVAFETARPGYMQAAIVVDWNKGGWTAPWESTGGPQQMSGTKAVLYPWVADEQPGVTVSAGIMTQLQLSYLAAGCKGAGLWAWNHRRAGFEGGEYGLLDRNEQVCERTIRVGQIARAANQLRDELWTGRRQPQVGILTDFDNEAVWAAISQCQRDIFKYRGVEGRIGAARTCIDASIPFEHLTGRDLEAGLAGRYPIIFLPSVIGLKLSHLPVLIDYVRAGGRVVMDMPGGCYDHTGRVMDTRAGSDFETLFGAELQDLQYSGNNADWLIDGEKIEGFTCDLKLTSAEAVQTYHNGQPAVTENRLGDGSAVIVGYEAARACYRPGHTSWQERLAEILLGGAQPFYRCEGQPVAYRLACDGADHYFLVNEGPAAEARFTRLPYDYTRVTDVLTGQAVDIHTPIEVADDDGRWLRCQRADG